MRRVCALIEAGSTQGRNPLLPPLRAALARNGIELVAWDPTERLELPPRAPDADLYLLKGDHPAILTAAGCLADRGARCLNSFGATEAAADKGRMLARLERAGLPVPATSVAGDRNALAVSLAAGPRFVKPVRGAHGDGARRLEPGEAAAAAGSGPWLVQELVPNPGYDLKLYGVRKHVAVRRACFEPGAIDFPREPVERPDPAVLRLARAAGAAAGLELYGVDVLETPDGPVVVDVNAFPGYRTVSEAPAWLAAVVLDTIEAAA